jgi:hypothetical protein
LIVCEQPNDEKPPVCATLTAKRAFPSLFFKFIRVRACVANRFIFLPRRSPPMCLFAHFELLLIAVYFSCIDDTAAVDFFIVCIGLRASS